MRKATFIIHLFFSAPLDCQQLVDVNSAYHSLKRGATVFFFFFFFFRLTASSLSIQSVSTRFAKSNWLSSTNKEKKNL